MIKISRSMRLARKSLRRLILLLPESLSEKIILIWRFRLVFRLWLRRLKIKLYASKSDTRYFGDDAVYWVDPRKIVYAANREFDVYEYRGRVIDGNWDALERKFTDNYFYQSYEDRFLKGISWEQTSYYQEILREMENGIYLYNCFNKAQLDEHCCKYDSIFSDIKQNGYKTREMLRQDGDKKSVHDERDEIAVNIGRYGDLIFNNGRHRLALARIAQVKKVAVTVTVRHRAWEEFKREIESYAQKNSTEGGRLYAPLTHIDFQSIPASHGHERFEIIRSNIGDGCRTLFDIGSNKGYFCHMFEEEGFDCTAVENDRVNLYFLQKLSRSENRSFKVVPESIFTFSKKGPLKYDVVLALNIFHHFLKEKSSFDELKSLLGNLYSQEMYFESHVHDEPQMDGAFVNFTPESFLSFIQQNSCLQNSKLIGEFDGGRQLFKLWR